MNDTRFNNALKLLKFTTKMHENEPEFHRKIIMSDEAHFHLGGYINDQNCRIWAEGIIELYFFENEARAAVFGEVNSRTQREDSCRYRRNRALNVRKSNGNFHQKNMALPT